MQRDEREEKKLDLFACAVNAMQTPPPSPSVTTLDEKQEPLTFAKYVGLSLAKLPPALYWRTKKRISDVLYEMEEQDDIAQGRYSMSDNTPQHGPR